MLPRAARLLNRRDFRAAYSRSRSYATARLVLHVHLRKRAAMPAVEPAAPLRIGFSISRKISKKAHDRNLLKRRLREITRLDVLPHLRDGAPIDTILTARGPAASADFAALRDDVCQLFQQAGIIDAEAQTR